MIGLVTDSSSQLPPELARRYGIEVVPITVVVDGTPHEEGVDLDVDELYAAYADGPPEVSTAHPSPGRMVEAYRAVVERGAEEILSIHVAADLSGTLNSARLAADDVPVPVRLVDTGTASFGVAACLWEAAEVVCGGGSADHAAEVAERVAASIGTVFVVQAPDLAPGRGRLPAGVADPAGDLPVLAQHGGGDIELVGTAQDAEQAAQMMVDVTLAAGRPQRVALGVADEAAAPFGAALEDRLTGAPGVAELVRYRVGASVAAHLGPGTAGTFFWPVGAGAAA